MHEFGFWSLVTGHWEKRSNLSMVIRIEKGRLLRWGTDCEEEE